MKQTGTEYQYVLFDTNYRPRTREISVEGTLDFQNPNQVPVDKWIDEIPEYEEYVKQNVNSSMLDVNRFILNQNLPRIDIPYFDGSPVQWVDFIIHFKELVHSQPYLSAIQRLSYL